MGSETLRGVAIVIAALAPPAVAVFRHPGRGLRLTERVLLAVALAPFALALPALALALFVRLPVDWCLWQSEFIWIVAALWPRSRPGPVPQVAPPEPLPERGHGFPSVAALSSALLAALLVAGVSLSVPMVRMWSDAWFHAAATLEVALRGVPPQDPNFAGVSFYYPWAYHFVLAMLGAGGKLSPFHTMALANAWAAFVTVLAAAQLAYRAFGRGAALWAGAIALLGLNPLGWLFWVLHGSVGEYRGPVTMIAQLASTNGAATGLSHLFPPWHASMLNRFWTGTALTPAIALGVATAWSTARALERPSRAAWLRTVLLALALFAIHPAYAAFAVASIGLGVASGGLAGDRRGASLALLGALGIASAAGLAWIRACGVPGATTAVHLGLYTRNLWSLLLAVGPWWVVAAPGFVVAWRAGPAGRFTLGAAVAAVAMSITVVLPEANSDKLFYFAWMSLAPLAAIGFVWWGDRLRLPAVARLALLTALIVPTAGLYTIGTASDRRSPGVLVRGDTPAARQRPLATGAENGGYRFMRERLPADAVVIESPRPTVNEPVPVLGERRVFCGSLDVYLSNHFHGGGARSGDLRALIEEFQVRRGIQLSLFADGELSPVQSLYLTEFAMPLYLMVRREEVSDAVWEGFRARPEWDELLANEQIRLYRFTPQPS
jgi:hypothetical protein